jgi:hypothetical protein
MTHDRISEAVEAQFYYRSIVASGDVTGPKFLSMVTLMRHKPTVNHLHIANTCKMRRSFPLALQTFPAARKKLRIFNIS